jgi:transcriptional regulator with XRE-family HTH domain
MTRAWLVKELDRPDVTERTLARFESADQSGPTTEQLDAIAAVCGLPTTFFSIDFGMPEDPMASFAIALREIGQQVYRIERRLDAALPTVGLDNADTSL